MLLRILLSVSILLLVAAGSLLIRVLKSSKAADDLRRRGVLEHNLGEDVLWSRGGVKAPSGISRRSFIPNVVTGIAALYLFKSAARAANVTTVADTKKDPPPPKHSDSGSPSQAIRADVPHSDARKADVPHSDAASAQRRTLAQNHSDARRPDVPHSDAASAPPPKHSDARRSDVPHSDASAAPPPKHSDAANA